MAYRFMQANQGRYAVREMTGLFGVSSGAYYQWAKHGVSERRNLRDAQLIRLIREIQRKHHNRYGSLRVREVLRKDYGERVSRKKVAVAASLPLMRENGLNARRRRIFIPPTTNSRHGLAVGIGLTVRNILGQVFPAEAGGQKWVSSYRKVRHHVAAYPRRLGIPDRYAC